MIYTIGDEKSYREAFEKYGNLRKTGKNDDYEGGYAFLTAEDAQRRIDEAYSDKGFAVWSLDADWEKDTYPSPSGWWHNLLHDRPILNIVWKL